MAIEVLNNRIGRYSEEKYLDDLSGKGAFFIILLFILFVFIFFFKKSGWRSGDKKQNIEMVLK